MRNAETSCDLVIDAEPHRVWRQVADITAPARFSPELQRVRWLDATTPAPGARFEGYNENKVLGTWRTIATIVECDEPRAFAWTVADPDGRFGEVTGDPMATWRFDLEDTGNGVRLIHSVRIGPARSGLSLAIDRFPDQADAFLRHRLADLRTGMLETLRGIKTLAER
ncbi:SRPBCC family protein [Amycolatopsis sp. 195334CR]|uniref:SRPBCC family protein n=1 Tax=Amycolatopsis sp. 195334CR TaxID=2814588 RepID=UPI001A8D75D6|nr:SRPBCC family protein [Amycolatopsis sp. 195334CR]MBN6041923.1 SRPBCC family protein [Amycolatopsis sp. 195334CR]